MNVWDLVHQLAKDDKRWLLPGEAEKTDEKVFVPLFGGHVIVVLYSEGGEEAARCRQLFLKHFLKNLN